MAREDEVVAFVEVKARRSDLQHPLEAIGRRKRRHLRRAAERWIREHPGVGREFRFDVIGIRLGRRHPRLTYVRDAFTGDDC